jgi:hypothetical protein
VQAWKNHNKHVIFESFSGHAIAIALFVAVAIAIALFVAVAIAIALFVFAAITIALFVAIAIAIPITLLNLTPLPPPSSLLSCANISLLH